MLFFKKRKKAPDYTPAFGDVEPVFPEKECKEAPAEEATVTEAEETVEETVTLDDGRVFLRSFVEEIRVLDAPDLKTVLEEQEELYTAEEFAYIREVFAERLGDIR